MKISIIILAIIVLSMTSCVMDKKTNSEDSKKIIKNFVKEYFNIVSLNPDYIIDSKSEYVTTDSMIIIPFIVENYENPQPHFARVSEDDFEELCIKNNDTKFNNSIIYTFNGVVPSTAFKEINLYTKTNYNNDFSENSLLNEITEVTYYTAKEYIDNGYRFKADDANPEYTTSIEDFKKTEFLTTFNTTEHSVVALDYIKLKLTSPPSVDGIYNFTIVLEDINGIQLRSDLTPIKLKGK